MLRYGTRLVIADRWHPSSRLCSVCDWKNEALTLKGREWTCAHCGTHHDRGRNGGAGSGMVSNIAREVTPVSYEAARLGQSVQERNRAQLRAPS